MHVATSSTSIRRTAIPSCGVNFRRSNGWVSMSSVSACGLRARSSSDNADRAERDETQVVLDAGASAPGKSAHAARAGPRRELRACRLRFGWAAFGTRPPDSRIYLAEASLLLRWIEQGSFAHLHAHFGTNPAPSRCCAGARGPPFSFTVHRPEEFDKADIGLGAKSSVPVRRRGFQLREEPLYRLRPDPLEKIHVVAAVLALLPGEHPAPIPAAPRLVCVGRLCEQKGQLLLWRPRRTRSVGIPLDRAGRRRRDAQRNRARFQESGLAPRRITGWADERQSAMSSGERGRWCCRASRKVCRS